ncbi:hypothetical protein [Nonomuraea jabiensis]|uniref:Uncharacterized protein n=1 Tax=Nonomuraea jabiensis TaxID=882448 RepID=A0A7W9G4Z9_9ACTN|nr:hypothetical protein [Nonomuraea jabiensis]MBB5777264.1 hypothetical protein [Nonomuraea jabiensis]
MSGPGNAAATGFRYPYVIGWTGEAERHRLMWVPRPLGGVRLCYVDSRPGDHELGVLRLRQNGRRAGRPDFTTVNTRRQWRCMTRSWCQVCGGSAVDAETGRIWWLLSSDQGEGGDGYTNAPPTCRACIPEAIRQCSHLRRHAAVFTVAECAPFGVRGDVFLPGLPPMVPLAVNRVVRLDDAELPHCLARELLMRVVDVREETAIDH